jgi:hypothetical protein
MNPWRVTVVDGQFGRYAGFAIVLAASDDEARGVVDEYLRNDTAYGKPYRVSAVVPHEHPAPHVLFMNWGEWDDWPLPTTLRQRPSRARPGVA